MINKLKDFLKRMLNLGGLMTAWKTKNVKNF